MNIVVTGGTKGIGRSIIELFASRGFDIITCARSAADLENLKKSLQLKHPQISVTTSVCDMGNKQAVIAFAKSITENNKAIDVLVNNAGVFLPGTIAEEEDETYETVMNVNMGGTYHFTRALLPVIKKTTGAHIFNMCSTASITAYTNGGSYCISKFAMLGFSKVLREELKLQNVKVTAILPGATYTNSWAGSTLPESRFMPSDEVAMAVWDCYNLKYSVVEELLLRPQEGDI